MPSLNFMERFAGMVERGEKLQTIRRVRKRPIKVGDTLQLYTGQRSKACRKLGEGRCVQVREIRLTAIGFSDRIEGEILSPQQRLRLANRDGFSTAAEFLAFFADHYGLPFEGVLIEWELEAQGNG